MNREQRRRLQRRKMYQAVVLMKKDDGTEREINVGPRWDNADPPANLCEQINKAVAAGKEKRWREARVVTVNNVGEST